MADICFASRFIPESFGGKVFWDNLIKLGLVPTTCPECGREGPFKMYPSHHFVPIVNCPVHQKRSCLGAGFFHDLVIQEPASFIAYVNMYVGGMQRSDIKSVTGLSNDQMVKFQHIVESTMIKTVDDMVARGEMMLGGEGKVVEIDEMCLTSTKYGRGRRPEEEVWVLGMVEVDAPVVKVVNTPVRMAVRAEAVRKEEARQRKRLSKRRAAASALVESAFRVAQGQMEVEELDEEDDLSVRPTGPSDQTSQRPINNAYLKALNALYKQSKDGQARKALFFPLPDRSAATLLGLIQAHVKAGSMVFTDEWSSYRGLESLGYRHYTVCHKFEFSHFYEEGVLVIRACTNHIERL